MDIAIVGAGCAGIAAAHACRDANRSYVVLEAQSYIGGRVLSDNTFPDPVDLGAEWFHFTVPADPSNPSGPTNNLLFDLAKAQGTWGVCPDDFERGMFLSGRRMDHDPQGEAATAAVTRFLQLVVAAAVAAGDDPAKDKSFAEATASMAGDPWYRFAEGVVLAGSADSLAGFSVVDYWRMLQLGPPMAVRGPGNHLIRGGMGNFIASLASGLQVKTGAPVQAIARDWNGVTLDTPQGQVTARAVIVTASIAVLAPTTISPETRIRFSPPLPMSHRTAIGENPARPGLQMHAVEKFAVRFKDSGGHFHWLSGIPRDTVPRKGTNAPNALVTLLRDQPRVPTAQVNFWSRTVNGVVPYRGAATGIVIIGGPEARDVIGSGMKARDVVQGRIVGMFGAFTPPAVQATTNSNWLQNPWIQGAYSYAPPRAAGLRAALAEPVDDRIYFAGEAVSVAKHSTITGAWETGRDQALKAIANLPPPLSSAPP